MAPEEYPKEDEKKIRRLRQAMYSRSLSGKLPPRSRRLLGQLPYAGATDWGENEGDYESSPRSRVAPKALMLTRNVLWWTLGAAVLFFVISAGAFVYYFTAGPGGVIASPGNIDISVSGPVSVQGGEPVELRITVKNKNRADLELTDLVITYPPGTRSPDDFSTAVSRQRISLGTIKSGESRQGTVSAVFVGKEGERSKVHIEVEYRVENSNAIFVAQTDYQVTFATSPISISIDAFDEVTSGQRMILTVNVASNVDVIVKDVLLSTEYPFGFTFEKAVPDPLETGNALWELGDIRPGEKKTIRIEGIMEGQTGEERVFRVTAGVREEADVKQIQVALSELMHRMAIARPFIGLSVSTNRESGEDTAIISPGQLVTLRVAWTNNVESTIRDMVIVANLKGITIAGNTVQVTDGFYRSSDRTILWDKTTTNGELTQVDSGESGVLIATFQIPPEGALTQEREGKIDIEVHAAARRGGNVPESLQSSATRTLKLASTVHFLAHAFYHANPFGSVGPLPPKVEEETTYAIVWTISNSSNAVKDAVVKGVLPPNVRWLGVYQPLGEQVSYSASEGTVEWRLGELRPGTGTSEASSPRQVAFAVGLTPSASQLGDEAPLMLGQVLAGTDSFAEIEVRETHRDLTTSLIGDPGFSTTEASVVQ